MFHQQNFRWWWLEGGGLGEAQGETRKEREQNAPLVIKNIS